MKTKLFPIFAILGIVTMLTFSSCSKDNSSANSPSQNVDPTKKGVLTCKINGTMWQSLLGNNSFAQFNDTNRLIIGGLKVVGSDSTAVVISLLLTPNKIGTYSGILNSAAPIPSYCLYYPNLKESTVMQIVINYKVTYIVNITKLDTVNGFISGTFSSTATAPAGSGNPNYTITEGVFTDVRIM